MCSNSYLFKKKRKMLLLLYIVICILNSVVSVVFIYLFVMFLQYPSMIYICDHSYLYHITPSSIFITLHHFYMSSSYQYIYVVLVSVGIGTVSNGIELPPILLPTCS